MGLKISRTSLGLTALRGLPSGLASITSASALQAAMGFAGSPDLLVKCNVASGAVDLVGSSDFTGGGTPNYETAFTTFDDVGTEMDLNTTDTLLAPNLTDAEPPTDGTTSWFFLWVGEITGFSEFSSHSVLGNRESSGAFEGYELLANGFSGGFRFAYKTNAVDVNRSRVPALPAPFLGSYVIAGGVDYTRGSSTRMFLMGNHWAETVRSISGAANSSEAFNLGENRGVNAAAAIHGMFAFFTGTDAEGIAQSNVDNLSSYLGI